MVAAPQRIREAPGVERGLMSHPWSDTGHEWLDQRSDASDVDANVAVVQRQKLLSQLGETSWMGPEHPSIGFASRGKGEVDEAPLAEGRVAHLYRGMSEGEFQEAKGRGHIASDMRGTFDIPGGEGTNAGTEPATAHSYMPRKGTGRIVKIAAHKDDAWFETDTDPYARSRQPIPWDRVVAHTEEFAHPGSDVAPEGLREKVVREQKGMDYG
jgi:hypothetical protein